MPMSCNRINNEDQLSFGNCSSSPSHPFPLSSPQQVVWLDQILRPDSTCYNLGSVILIEGELDEALLVRAFETVVDRHDVLRLRLVNTQELPLQELADALPVSVTIHDFSGHANSEELAEQHIRAALIRPFDLNGELWRFELLRVSDNRWYWQFSCHHLIADGITLGLIPEEIANTYSRLAKGEELTEAVPSYLDFIDEDIAYLNSQRYRQDRQFWLERYKNLPPTLIQPSNSNKITEHEHPEPLIWQLDKAIYQRIEDIVAAQGLSVLHFMYAVLACYFSRTSHVEEIVLGIPVHNRKNVKQRRIVGMFSSVIPVGITVTPHDTFLDVMNKTAAELRRCYKRQRLPIAELNRHIQAQQKTGQTQLFDIMLSFEQIEVNAGMPNATLAYSKIQRGAPFPLVIAIHQYAFANSKDAHKPYTLEFDYSPDYLSRAEAIALQSRLMTLIEGALTSPEAQVRNLPILPPAEQQQLLVDFNTTQADYPQDALVHPLVEAQAAQQPDATAVMFEGQTLSYGELNRRANRLAHHLIALGVRPDERVAICVERSLEMVVGLLAILKAGGAYVPLDPAYPTERLAYMLRDSAPVVLLTQTALAETLNGAVPAAGYTTVLLDTRQPYLAEQPTHNPDIQALGLASHHLAYVIYTSGSTGLPKGVEMPLAALSNLLHWHRHSPSTPAGIGKTLQFSALGFDVAFQEIFTTLCEGGCLVLINEAVRREPQQFLRLIRQEQVNRIFLPYIALQHLAEAANDSEDDFSYLAHIITAGEQLRITPAIQRFLQRAGHCQLHNHYGPTESHVVTSYTLGKEIEQWPTLPPIGRPIANTQIYILDEYGQPVPFGITGEIHIAGAGVARGYLNRPELTAERFLADPFSADPNARMYKTGDLGRWLSDGNIEYLGRNDFQVKLRGFRIELGEIEAQLMRCHGVREAVVLAREDELSQKRLVAYLRPQEGVELVPAELRQQLAEHLAEYMLPSAFVTLATFPLTPNGKLDRKALPAPDSSAIVTRDYAAPVGEIEMALAQIWQNLLGLERVGRHDHFFELGGHSLLAVQLVARIRQTLARELPLQQLFTQPILMDLAHTITNAAATTQAMIPVADRSQPLPLSFAQQRLWFLSQLDPAASLAYHIPVALRLTGELNFHTLTTALERLVARHESLRTRFVLVEGQPCQHIDPADMGFALSSHDLRQLDPALHISHIVKLTDLEAQTPFDFTQGPLIRGQLLQLTDEEHVLLLTLHHIITDGWSIGVFVREFDVLYHAILNDYDAPLPPLPIQYVDYAVWQREWLQGNNLTEQRDFWYAQLENAPALLSLPTDRPRPAVQTYVGSQVPFHLDASVLTSLKALGQRHNTTLFMTVLAAWSIVLARLSGQDDIVIGTPVANRPHRELEGLMGFFVNTLALRVRLNDDLSVTDLLTQVREQALAAYAHQDLPFEQVVEALQPERSLSYSPIFQVMLALDNTPVQEQTSPGLQISRIEQVSHSAHFDLMLLLTETDTGLIGGLEYASDLFDSTTVERMVGYLQRVLAAMATDTTQAIARLPMLSESERQQLLVDFNATHADFPQDALIHQLFEAQMAQCPTATAVVCENQTLSYDELNRHANRLAHHLIALGVRPDDRVTICVERRLEMVVGLLAILKAGGAYVPLDPAYPTERLAYMLEDSAPIVILTQTALVNKLTRSVPKILLDNILDTQTPFLTEQPDHNPDAQVLGLTSRHLAYVIYTSGSTGLPKGVAIEHRNTVNFLTWAQQMFSPTELVHTLFATSLNFDLAVYECFAPLLSGGTVHLVPDVLSLVNTESAVTKQAISLINTVPSAIARLIEVNAVPMSVRTVNLAGEALKSHVVEHLFTHTHVQNVCNLYGPSETTTYSTWTRMHRATGFDSHIGRPIANTRIYILDPHGQPVPLGAVGEIHIAGAGVARGYLNRPELTTERFLSDPFSSDPDARMYKTGDLGRWLSDGNIEYLGRNDFQVKLRGFRIELGEIEAQLIQCHGVREAVVISREEESGQKRLVAYLRPQEGVELLPNELRQQLAQHLAEYMLPSAFVTLAVFPLTPNGKLDRKALPAPDSSAVVTHGYAAPVGEIEIALAQIWQDLLGLEQVGRHDHFFELGGHSLMIVSLIERLYSLGWQLDVRSVFSAPVLSVMAQAIQRDIDTFVVPPNRITDGCTAITPDMLPLVSLSQAEIDAIVAATPGGAGNIQDIYPLAPLQEGILFHHLLQTQGDTYLLHCMLAFDIRSDLDAFLSGLQQVIDRHDILRTAACWQGLVKPVQVVWRQASLHVNVFTPATADDVPSQLQAHVNPRESRLDLSRAPLFAADIAHDPAQDRWLLVLRFHHLVSDHMTLELIFAEIAQIRQGQTEALPAALPYRNFIAQTLSVPTEVHEAYFRTQLADIDTPTAPFGVLSIQDDSEPIVEAHLSLDPALAEAIRTQARHLGVSPGVLFHVAWAQVLAQTSGCNEVVFGSVLSGRLQGGAGASRTLGMFINTLPVRISLAGRHVQDVVQATYHNLTALLEHEQAPLALAQRCSAMAQPTPLFSTLLNYRHTQLNEADVIEMPQIGMRIIAIEERTNYPVTLTVDDTNIGFRLTAQTVTRIDPTRITTYLMTAVRGLVDALAHHPQPLIQALSILPATERQQLLVDFNATQVDFPQNALIHQLFEAQVQRHPDAIAVVFEGESLSYDELNRRANRLAHHLIALGVRPDDRVAICVERSPQLIVGLLAILKAGGAYLPLDPTYPSERLMYMLEDAEPVALLTQTTHVDKLGSHIPAVLLDAQESFLATQFLSTQAAHNPDIQALNLTSRHLAYVIYTSGSTGLPKGVMVEHRNVLRLIINSGFADIGPDDCVAHCANIAFDASTWEIWSALLNGGCLHVVAQSVLLDPVHFCDSLIKGQVTALWLTAGLFNEYLDALKPLFGQLRYLLVGGDVLDPKKIQHVQMAESQPACLINGYGPTETTTFAATYAITSPVDVTRSIPIGSPIANTRIYILDPYGQPVPLWAAGEIYIAGAGVARGYLNQPELTAERFLVDPFSPDIDARMYKTGDLGRWLSDGNIEYLGRNDFQVKLRGFRIELGEIETKLEQCDGVREAVVIVRDDKRLVAYVQPMDGAGLVPAELRRQLAKHLAEYMLPSAFVTLKVFPLTPNGKLDRQALPAPDLSAVVAHGYAAPVGETEIALARIWQKLLGLEQVGRHDHFFELGGHSLLAVQLVAHVRQDLARELSLQQLFDQPLLIDLAQMLTDASTTAPLTIPVADRNRPLPLSFAQQRLWFLSQLDQAASLAYHIPVALRLTGQLNHQALSYALDNLVTRQEILRTRFVLVAGQPCQQIDPVDIGFALSYQDLRPLAPEERHHRMTELVSLETQTPFDFIQGPLIRGYLLQLTDEEHVLLLTHHHIISDGWSISVLMRELSALYRAALEGESDPLPPLPIQYADYAVWQRHWLQETTLTTQRDFWRVQLEEAPALLALPTDRPRPTVQSFVGGRVPVHFDRDLLASLKGFGQRHNSTLFMTVLTGWSIVLARLSGQDDIVIGTPVANRPHHELEGLVGFFVNTLALRVTLHNSISVSDLLNQVRERALAAYAHQDLPFEQVVEALQPERNLSYSPIFQVMLALNNTPSQALTLPDLRSTPVEQTHYSAHFDLTLSLTETETGLVGDLVYAADLFDAAAIGRMVSYLNTVLAAMVAGETQSIATLPMLPVSERQHLLVDFNTTQADFPQEVLIHQLFEAQAANTPDAIAVVFEGQTLSYDELNCRANRLAHYLLTLGVRPDDRVAMCVERSMEMVVGLMAILKAGGAYVPLDPAYPAERLTYMLEDAAPRVLLTQETLAGKLPDSVPVLLLDTQDSLLASQPAHNPDSQALGLTSRHLAYVIYTSGSTGVPKGVMVEHRSLSNLITTQQATLAIKPDSRILQFASNSFDACIWECCMALLGGARLHLARRTHLLPGPALQAVLETQAITHILLSPTALAAMDALPETLETLLVGGEACQVSQVKRWSEKRRMLNAYGPTEITVCAAMYLCDSQEQSAPPIGRPIANTQIYVLDPEGQPVPVGVAGEIYIAGAGVARGYLNRPELTAERFLTDPFSSEPDARMYKTGDLGRWRADGNVEYLGRNDFQVKLRGFRIELGEIEAKLVQCQGVREAIVLIREDEPNQKRLVAYLRPQDGIELVPAELRQQLSLHLAEYMLPSAFVTLEAFPLTPNGKLDRQALPAPDTSAFVASHYESPIGEAENALAQIWQNLLGLKHVSRHDHFFELGGHSLMIVSLIEELRGSGWQLDVRSVFAAPVLADMAKAAQRDADTFVVPPNPIPDGCTAITPDMLPLVSLSQTEIDTIISHIPDGAENVQDIYPLAPLQEGILFHHLLQTQGDDYLLQVLLAFNTRERLDAFLSALQQVIGRYDILRTAVYWQDLAKPVQVVWRQAPLPINVFTPTTGDDVTTQLRAHTDPRRHRIDLTQAPLFAADIAHDPAQNEWLLTLRFHHVVSDHMTLELIFAEIDQILQGNSEILPVAVPYRNFIAQTLSVPVSVHEAYFREQLADIDEPTAPFGVLTMPKAISKHCELPEDSEPVAKATLALSPDLAKAIRTQARRLGVSPSVLFHVAWAQVLAKTSGRDDVVFGSVLLGRLQGIAGANQTLGMFINTLPVRISLNGRNVQDIVQDTYRNLTKLLEHEQAPLALAQRCSGVAQPMPLFSALLNYRHSQTGQGDETDTIWADMRVLTAKERTNYPITLSVDDLGHGFQLTALTVTEIAPDQVTTYLATAIKGLIDALVHNPQQWVLDVPVLPEAERQQLLVDFNTTQAEFPQEALIHQLIETQVLQRPDATAVIYEGQTLSYDELNQRANRLAHHLIALGVRPDDRVAICIERSLEMVIGLLAILKAGGAYLPLDPTYPVERLDYMLGDAAPVALLTQTRWIDKLASALPTVLLDHLLNDDAMGDELNTQASFIMTQPTDNPDVQAHGLTSRHLAYVIYTSGSTGQPKGVMVEHRSVLRLIINNRFADIGPDDCIAHCANISFDAATWEVWSALAHGARVLLVPEKTLLQPARFGQCLISENVSALFLTTALFNQYANLIAPSLSGLRYVLFGGEQTDTRSAIRLRAEHPPQHLLHIYGPTETTTFATAYEIPFMEAKWGEGEIKIPIGRPISNTQVYILDKQGQPAPLGVAGEIYIAGAGVARGYLNRPELTAERFLVDPFSSDPDARMYKTGDLGRWLSDGNVEYLGRNDFQVKLRGFRIELGEIEARLGQCHGVREAVVLIREDAFYENTGYEKTGYEKTGNQKRLVAYLRPQDGIELVPAELRQQLSRHLAEYMLPSAFIMLDAFPLTPNGKLDRQALPAPDSSAVVTRDYEAPVGETEMGLARIWQDLLGLERVGRYDHFFELGGHSLLAVQLAARVRQMLARELPLQQLFDQPILADLAQVLTAASITNQVAIPVADRNQPLPLSFAQQRLWFLGQLDPAASLAYHIPVALRLTGQLNHHALTRALDNLVARQEILRTRFVLVAGQPCQQIDPADIGFALSYQDLRALASDAHISHIAENHITQNHITQNHITELATLETQTPFDFTQGPLIRGYLLQLADEEHVLLITQHHIISDGWSIGVLIHEMGVLYRAALDGQDAPLPPLPIQYADYAVWQRDSLQETTLAAQRDFWCTQLKGAPALLALPTDRPRPAGQSFIGGRVPVHFDADLLASLKGLGQRHNSTLFMVVLTAWNIVLARLSGQDDIVIGTPVANRQRQELEGMIGFFVNTLALRVTLNDSSRVADLLTQVREQAFAAYAHQDLPFEQVVEALQPERSLSYSPIFQVMLALNNTPAQDLALPGLQLTPIEQVHHSAHFDLTLSLTETDTGLEGELAYAVDLFDSATIERMVGYLANVLAAMAIDETQIIATLPMLPLSEQQQLLEEFNAHQVDFPQDALIHQLFEAQAAHRPDAVAVVFEEQTLSYGELNCRANRLAHHLIARGVRPDDRIAICVERSLEMVVGLLAILKTGGAYVPLDPAYPADRLAYVLEDSAPVVILTQATLADKLTSALPTVLLDDQASFLTTQRTDNPDPQTQGLTSRHLAYVIYTSGSTGKPKGVMVEHANVIRLFAATQDRFRFDDNDVWTLFHSFAFDFSVWELWGALSYGGRLVIISADCARSPQMFYSLLCREQVTVLNQTPSAFRQLIAAQDVTPHSLRCIIFGGEALELHTLAPWVARNPTRQTRLVNMYGITEITVHATYRELTESDINSGRGSLIGQPLSDLRIYILDAYGQPAPLGVAGEIYIVGAGVARGYLNRPELTAERFLADPFLPDSDIRMYKTGDLGRWLSDGNIEYLGRNDFQVKIRGFRIELGEIEARLEQCHGVREALVLAREDEPNQKRLVAYLLPQAGVSLVPAELRQQLTQHLAEYMLPSAFVTLDAFPLTPNGKLDRRALPVPDSSAIVVRSYEAPVSEIETALARIWQNLLGLERVGRHDHFFELGGHSLMIVSLIEELRNIGWQLDVRSVFVAPVLADMARAIRHKVDTFVVPPNRIPQDCTAITPNMLPLVSLSQTEIDTIVATVPGGAINVQDIYPLSPLQEGILFHHLLQTQGDNYLLQSLLTFDSRERLDTFLTALQQVIDRHDILRTSAYWQELAQPVQVVWRQAPLVINVFNPTTTEDVAAQLRTHTDPRRHRINLNRAPLFIADIAHDTAQDEWLLALRFHHLVSDHMTLELIFAEIALILQGNVGMLPAVLPYRNFIAQTLSVPASDHEAYFRDQLTDISEPTAPFGVLKVPTDDTHVTEARLSITSEQAETIRTQARRLGVSPSVLFHVAWAQVLAQTSGRSDVVFGSVLLGRLQGGAGAERVLGMFINTLPMRVSLTNRTVQQVVQDTYHNLMMLLEHEQAPLVLSQRCSGVPQSMPLFSTLLNYRHSQTSGAEGIDTTWAGIRVLAAEERTNYPITLSVDDLGVSFQLTAQAVAGIEPARIINYLATAISGLIEALARDPQQLIRDISILPATERQQLLVDFNATQADLPHDVLIHQLFEAHAAHHPDTTAIVFEEQIFSYGELNRRANQLAHYLLTLGVQPDDRVAICIERSPELIVGLLAILKAGGAYVPLDPSYPAERLVYMLEDSAPVVLLTQATQADKLLRSEPVISVPLSVPIPSSVPIVVLDTQAVLLAEQPTCNPDARALGLMPHHLAYVIYTSGSTGLPKGVMIEHRSVLRLIIDNGFTDIRPDDCVAHCANIAFDASTWEIWSALLNGARLHIVSQSVLLDPVRFCDSLTKGQVTALWLTAGLFNEYHHYLEPVFSQLRYLLAGGDVLDPRKIRAVQLAESQPATLINGYGPTETTTFAATYAIASPVDAVRSIPIGRPIANTQIYILDEYGQPVPFGVTGEIHIAGMGVARGYLNRPELTTERFLSCPFSSDPDARMYKTGDLGRWLPDGNIEYLGRNDFQIKLRGFRIEPGEIEAQLMQCHGVRDAVVLAREDEPNQKRLVAYLQPQAGVVLVPADLRQQLAQQLADYMLPSAFVTLDAFPLTPNGKLDRQALPLPDADAVVTHDYEAPQGRIETALAQIWQDLLGLARISRHDNFFELGGHSLMVVRLITRIKNQFMVNIPLTSLFISPTLMEQADIIFSAQMNEIGENEIESMQSNLDSMSAEELMAILGGDNE
ncbi:non-ribosomal peptide synthetase [Xenorhabdus sp. PB62.4]|uniref:non-ribosomal peptide synthetase n=1 Tax=Xenorhabdus sp. PB62.4 TaxID=1851573 RepID=UPI001657120A|nr:non-ribosomal peptide synthase/polyketide synthase [Xenorhabdus sp. PB62.4]MBC8953403.1 Amino acid adenylation [Xenorhabdus sp. PB62.4]